MTSGIVASLRRAGSSRGVALESGETRLSRAELCDRAENLASKLRRRNVSTVALYLDNGIEWIISDLACQLAALSLVPLPLFFSDAQRRHALDSSRADAIIGARGIELRPGAAHGAPVKPAMLPPGTQKITFTSGTTGTPKGVCLSASQQLTVANTLASVIDIDKPRHLCVLPLSTLLENLAGVYAPLLAGGTVIAPPLADAGLAGSSGLDVGKLLACINRCEPNTLILVPEMLNALALAAGAGWRPPPSLRFVAVGGGKVSPALLRRARKAGIPAFEGYGLSECASVVSLNVPAADEVGAVGRPLPHVELATRNGEIVVRGSVFLGYVNQPESWGADCVCTGDLGHIDRDGFLHVDGRRKDQIITSYGRNLSPEWVESELLAGPLLRQAVVVGDDRPYCVALVYPRTATRSDREIAGWIDRVNAGLPDYARIADWYRLPKALGRHDGLLTGNGRPRRSRIAHRYQFAIDSLYETCQEAFSQ